MADKDQSEKKPDRIEQLSIFIKKHVVHVLAAGIFIAPSTWAATQWHFNGVLNVKQSEYDALEKTYAERQKNLELQIEALSKQKAGYKLVLSSSGNEIDFTNKKSN